MKKVFKFIFEFAVVFAVALLGLAGFAVFAAYVGVIIELYEVAQ